MNNIINDPDKLTEMPMEEVVELLLDCKYNKANLRELIRRCVHTIKLQKQSIKGYSEALERAEKIHREYVQGIKEFVKKDSNWSY